jgi:hypothetical protein
MIRMNPCSHFTQPGGVEPDLIDAKVTREGLPEIRVDL